MNQGIFLMLVLAAAVACKPQAEPAAKPTVSGDGVPVVRLTPDALKAADLHVEKVEPHPYKRALRVSGVVKANPNRLVDVSSLIPGRAVEVLVNIGDRVRVGQVSRPHQ